MLMPKALCVICKSELAIVGASEHCGATECRMAWLRQRGDRAQAQYEEKYQVLRENMRADFACWEQEQQSDRQIKIVEIPHNPHQAIKVSAERKQAFLSHLRRLLDSAETEEESQLFTPLIRVESTKGLEPILGSLCATCNGHCCRLGHGTQAFIQKQTLHRVMQNSAELDDEKLLALYESFIPEEAVKDSCIFHTDTGCCLEAELRADICDSFFCESLRHVIDDDFEEGGYDGLMAFGVSHFEIKRRVLIDKDGKRSHVNDPTENFAK